MLRKNYTLFFSTFFTWKMLKYSRFHGMMTFVITHFVPYIMVHSTLYKYSFIFLVCTSLCTLKLWTLETFDVYVTVACSSGFIFVRTANYAERKTFLKCNIFTVPTSIKVTSIHLTCTHYNRPLPKYVLYILQQQSSQSSTTAVTFAPHFPTNNLFPSSCYNPTLSPGIFTLIRPFRLFPFSQITGFFFSCLFSSFVKQRWALSTLAPITFTLFPRMILSPSSSHYTWMIQTRHGRYTCLFQTDCCAHFLLVTVNFAARSGQQISMYPNSSVYFFYIA